MKDELIKILASRPELLKNLNVQISRLFKLADHLIENGVIIQKHSSWTLNKDGSGTCNNCRRTTVSAWDFDNYLNYCPHCGACMDGDTQ